MDMKKMKMMGKSKKMDPIEKKAKLGILDDLVNQADKAISKKVMSVNVAGDNKEDVKKGLDKAKQLLDKDISGSAEAEMGDEDQHDVSDVEGMDEEESPEEGSIEEESSESPEKQLEELPADELEKKIKELQLALQKKKERSPADL
jgi:hypothetical protein